MSVTISTPSRLHFGLLRFEQPDGPSFGGLGMMIAEPRCTVRLAPSNAWHASGPDAERAIAHARRALEYLNVAAGQRPAGADQETPDAFNIEVLESIPPHQGLGSGTQLALAVAAGVRALCGVPEANAEELAAMTGRGRRSAVGCYGFTAGGLILEHGSLLHDQLGRLLYWTEVPDEWRIVLITASRSPGLSASDEAAAFGELPPIPTKVTERLEQLAAAMLPCIDRSDVESFGEALFEYGSLAGECFASVQGGPYASAEIAACVETLRGLGVRGVGQSSWGPTVFACAADQAHADEIVARMRAMAAWQNHAMRVTAADNSGAHTATSGTRGLTPRG